MTRLNESVGPVSIVSAKMEEPTRTESHLSHFSKPEQYEDESKGQYAWRLIRHCVRDAIELVSKADIKDLVLSHGVHSSRKLNHTEPLKQILFNKYCKEYITIDDHIIRVFHRDGRKKEIITPQISFKRLIYAAHINLYVGWTPDEAELVLMNDDFEVSSISDTPGPITNAVYNEAVGEIVTLGPGYLTNWVFRYGGRHLLPRKTACEGFEDVTTYSNLVLEETASRHQMAYASSGTNVAVFNLFDGSLLYVRKELHVRMITALLFFNPLKYLVTASKDGSIKVWDDKWHLQLVFVGHGDAVLSLCLFPYGPLILSSSLDCTMRVWSLETCDEVDIVPTAEPVLNMVTSINSDEFASLCHSHADLWKIQHIHMLHTRVGCKVVKMKTTDHPGFPTRCVLLGRNASIRILCPLNGEIITTALVSSRKGLVDAAYSIENDLLFCVNSNGDITKCDTTTNPCTILAEWKCTNSSKACNYLLVYEYVISADMNADTWGAMKRAIATKGLKNDPSAPSSANRTLLLGGRRDGYICVFDMATGKVDFEIEAHGTKGVLSMIANSKYDQLISAGLDNIIKIWRLFPYAQESLAPLMSFYCAHTPIHMTVMRSRLAVAFQEHTTATYNVVMYNLEKKSRQDHGPEDDHTDTIIALTSCSKLKITASSSADNTVRIWNENNVLIRLLKLNARPHSLTFCSSKGDLLVGIGDNVHVIDYKNYMPKRYRFKMVSMQFPIQVVEKPIPFSTDLIRNISRDDYKRLKAAQASINEPVHGWCQQSFIPYRFTHFVDMLTDNESDEVMKEKKIREQAFFNIEERDKDLLLLKDGQLTSKRKPKSTPQTKSEAFDKYLKFFYDRPRIKMPYEDLYPEDTVDQLVKGPPEPPKDVYKPEKEPTGFFPPASTARQTTELDDEIMPIKPDCYVPNSVLLRLLWPPQAIEEAQKPETEYKPPGLTEEQMKQIAALNDKAALDYRDTTIYLDYDSDTEEKKEPEETHVIKPETPATEVSRVHQLLAKVPTPPPIVVPEPEIEIPAPVMVVPPKIKEKMTQPVVMFSPKVPAPPKREERTPSPPQTPLPDFITQFIGQDWFEKYFPDTNPENFPKPWNMSTFVNMLLRVLKVADYHYKVDIVNALLILQRSDGLPNADKIHDTLLLLLGPKRNAPSSVQQFQKEFIMSALELLHLLGIYDKQYYVELMVQFMEGDMDIRRHVIHILEYCGLKDNNGYLANELDTWDVWDLDEDERPHELRNMSGEWLEKWSTSFKIHLQDTIDRLKKGQNVHGRVSKKKSKASQSSLLKRHHIDGSGEARDSRASQTPTLHDTSKPLREEKSVALAYLMTFDEVPDSSTIDSVTYIEAINYFCEIQLEKELDKMRSGVPVKDEGIKNTVLVLPKIPGKSALVRLGETHTSKCQPRRETVHDADLRLPPITSRGHLPKPGQLFAFPTCVNLPMKQVYMNPFPNPGDALELLAQHPVLLTLKSSQKFFVPSRSHVAPELM